MQQRPILTLPGRAAGAITRQRFVKYDMTQASAGTDVTLGVADYDAAVGQQFNIIALGTAKIEAGGAFALGADVKPDANGRAVDRAGAGVAAARALQAATAAGQIVEVLLLKS